ncbi:uncharacterized protein BCR38DRAFT_471084 [Pseudomassariella vexata]|uniref:Uncharacterized protein n=1 Tax=Pseudomassariella vexata TaxID=1141098 RepID=A0A1Y2EFN0_9PEZI|nr:uncharacterized protein BCR38DRAFT_471084 [Pseudomassariella vexata]ORY69605.1 hypothetical protein BCR38DRAFT_471084 [Pseudomassariella vexata]
MSATNNVETAAAKSVEKDFVPALQSFPTLKPALRIKTYFNQKFNCGDVYSGSTLVAVPFSGGVLESVGDFEPKLKLAVNSGTDWFRIDADKTRGRISVKAIAIDDEGRSISLGLEGITVINEATMPLILGAPDAQTPPFGYGIQHLKIEAGHEQYKPLEGMLFATSLRFTKEEGDLTGVEIRASRILPGSGMK